MKARSVACCPCFETLASLAPQHEVVVFQQVRPHPEEAANGSRECAPDDRLRAVSKDGLQYRFVIPGTRAEPSTTVRCLRSGNFNCIRVRSFILSGAPAFLNL